MTNTPEQLPDVQLQVLHYRAAQEIDRRGGAVDSYAAPHVWNLVAKILRETYPQGEWGDDPHIPAARATLQTLVLKFAQRFAEDDGFDPLVWLDKCSPDPDLYPFSEMWEEVDIG